MGKYLNIIIIACMLTFGTSCALFRNPTKSFDKAVNKEVQVEKKIDKNEDNTIRKGVNYVFANKLALEADPSTNRFHEVETTMTDKALLTLGPPSMEDENILRDMISNLLSSNKVILAKGEKQLAALDKQVIELQKENDSLKDKLGQAQDKVISVGKENSIYASRWTSLMKIFWYGVYFLIAVVVFKILAVVVPPPYNSAFGVVDFILGGILRFVFKLAPKAMETAKVVGAEYKTAVEHIVTSVEDAKTKIQAKTDISPTTGLEQLKNELKTNTNETTKVLINRVKESLGYV